MLCRDARVTNSLSFCFNSFFLSPLEPFFVAVPYAPTQRWHFWRFKQDKIFLFTNINYQKHHAVSTVV